MTIRYAMGPTSIGHAFLAATERGVCSLYFYDEDNPRRGLERLRNEFKGAAIEEDQAGLQPTLERLREVIAGQADGNTIALDLSGSDFQKTVWDALRAIPRGQTRTYGQLAAELGQPGAARAVGTACGANPVALLVPCHRALRAGGGLGGFRWGLEKKEMLLALERDQAEQMTLAGI